MGRNRYRLTLLAGDLSVLLAFTFGGMAFHRSPEGFAAARVLEILLPFAVGYLSAGAALGAFRSPPSGGSFALRSAAAWLVGIVLGVLLRSLLLGRPPILSFVLVTLLFTGVCFGVWRGLYWLLWGRSEAGPSEP